MPCNFKLSDCVVKIGSESLSAHKCLRLAWIVVVAGTAVSASTPTQVPPADLVDPPAYTVGPGTTYEVTEA